MNGLQKNKKILLQTSLWHKGLPNECKTTVIGFLDNVNITLWPKWAVALVQWLIYGQNDTHQVYESEEQSFPS